MGCNDVVTVNVNGIPYLTSKNVQVTTEAVNIAMGFRRIAPVGLFALRIATAIPEGTTGTLPVNLTLNGTTRALTQLGGDAVTAADLVGTGVILVFNDLYNGVLQVVSPLTATA